jgi:hypothetical protein
MKFMIFVKATADSEANRPPSAELVAAMGKYNEELIKAGVLQDGGGLHPTARGARVHFSGDKRTVTKGPFGNTNELVSGYWIWEVESLDKAIEWVKRCPNPMFTDSDIDIRPIISEADFMEMLGNQ